MLMAWQKSLPVQDSRNVKQRLWFPKQWNNRIQWSPALLVVRTAVQTGPLSLNRSCTVRDTEEGNMLVNAEAVFMPAVPHFSLYMPTICLLTSALYPHKPLSLPSDFIVFHLKFIRKSTKDWCWPLFWYQLLATDPTYLMLEQPVKRGKICSNDQHSP